MARYPLVIKISNLLVYIILLGANAYSSLGPQKDDSPYRGRHPTYISPAPFVFGVWGVIHFLLGGFVIYQFFASHEDLIIDGISWHFVGITLFNSLWLYLWQIDYLVLGWIVIIITASQVSFVYKVLKQNSEVATLNETVWVHAPFSLYHAWIFVIAVVSTFATFTHDKTDEGPSVFVKILVVIGLLVLESTAIAYIEKGKGDIAGAVVIAWSLYGIFVEQQDPVIHWTSLVLAIITTLHIIKPIVLKIRNRNAETTPLLAGGAV